jgi:hypothetical protein
MPLFSRHKDDPKTDRRDPEDFSGGPGLKDYSDTPDEQRLAPDDPRKPDSPSPSARSRSSRTTTSPTGRRR